MNNEVSTKQSVAAVILAAGKGKRMLLGEKNKVTSLLHNKPIILHIVQFMKKLSIATIVIVVGHGKESVAEVLNGEQVIYAEQTEQLGTGDALRASLTYLPENIKDVYVVYGDDAVFYNDRHLSIMEKLFAKHFTSQAAVTFITIEQEDPFGLGRIVRDSDGKVLAIVEEKDASESEKAITEINPGCFLFNVAFLRKYLSLVEKSPVTGEYYLTSIIDIALKYDQKVETVKGGKLMWRGVNTPEELAIAESLVIGME